MDNLKQPASPYIEYDKAASCAPSFTKLEYASLMIAQGVLSHGWPMQSTIDSLVAFSVGTAKAVLEEANK
jgi:hypothetical protein